MITFLQSSSQCLQDATINKIDWEEKGINMDGEHLSHLIFTDDIILIAHTPQELKEMLVDINNYSKLGKTKIMLNNHTEKATVEVDRKAIEEVEKYVSLGKTVSRDGDLMPEIKRCITLGWAAFNKVDNIMRSRKASMQIKKKVFNEYVLPVMTYGSETWALTTAQMDALAVAQRKMERIMLGITLCDQRHNTWIRQQTGVTDITDHIRQSKHRWAGHVARLPRQQVDHQSNILGSTEMVKTTRKTENKMER